MSDEPAQSGVGAATGEGTTEPAQMPPEGQDTGEAPAPEQVIAEEYIRRADEAFKADDLNLALSFVRAGAAIAPTHREAAPHRTRLLAGVYTHGTSNDKLCKRYLFILERVVKGKASPVKLEGPPRMLYKSPMRYAHTS